MHQKSEKIPTNNDHDEIYRFEKRTDRRAWQ